MKVSILIVTMYDGILSLAKFATNNIHIAKNINYGLIEKL